MTLLVSIYSTREETDVVIGAYAGLIEDEMTILFIHRENAINWMWYYII